ncbi:hypothetical protein MBAV_001709, partial [Candidatus Magnetobacterium bavaricum]
MVDKYTSYNDSTSDILLSNVKIESRCNEGTFESLLHKKLMNKTAIQKARIKYNLTRKYRET